MTDSESTNPAANGGARPPRGRTGKAGKPASRRRTGGDRGRTRRIELLHQSRVLAMQALYEEDLTDHELDDILQHMGEDHRRVLTDSFSRVRSSATNIIETLVFLVRQADLDAPDTALRTFDDASGKALRGLSGTPESSDGESAEEEPEMRWRAEAIATPMLEEFRKVARQELQRALKAAAAAADRESRPDTDDTTRELAAHLAQLSGQHVPAGVESGNTGATDDPLDAKRQVAIARLRETLGAEERALRTAMMEMLQRTGRLARGVRQYEHEIDPRIERAAPAFPIPQLASIDRSVLRVALYELFFEPDVPFKVAINEAVDIAKQYGGPNSGKFVNGVLRTISDTLPAARTAGS